MPNLNLRSGIGRRTLFFSRCSQFVASEICCTRSGLDDRLFFWTVTPCGQPTFRFGEPYRFTFNFMVSEMFLSSYSNIQCHNYEEHRLLLTFFLNIYHKRFLVHPSHPNNSLGDIYSWYLYPTHERSGFVFVFFTASDIPLIRLARCFSVFFLPAAICSNPV